MAYREHMTVVADVVRPDGWRAGGGTRAWGGRESDAAILRGYADALCARGWLSRGSICRTSRSGRRAAESV